VINSTFKNYNRLESRLTWSSIDRQSINSTWSIYESSFLTRLKAINERSRACWFVSAKYRGLRCSLQIIFEGRKAVGVVVKHEDKQKIVRANNEVVLSAGTVGTAKLLLLSGVGPKNHLQALKASHVSPGSVVDAGNYLLYLVNIMAKSCCQIRCQNLLTLLTVSGHFWILCNAFVRKAGISHYILKTH